jgi:hypothetical protein
VASLVGHDGPITALAWSQAKKLLASASTDTTIRLWDLREAMRKQSAPKLTPSEIGALVQALGLENAAQAFKAGCRLAEAGDAAIPCAQAVLRPAPGISTERLKQLLNQLDAHQFEKRQRALAELKAYGADISEFLEQAQKGSLSAEASSKVRQLLEACERPLNSGPKLRDLRLVEALEHIGSEPAKKLLKRLAAGDPQALLTRTAREALQRMDENKMTDAGG